MMTDPEFAADLTGFSGQAPLFPLPNVVLFPHVALPLHIFEPRYRDMVADALASDRMIGMVDRIQGKGGAVETPVGLVPTLDSLNTDGLELPKATLEALLHVERDEWIESLQDLGEFYRQFGSRLPAAISAGLATTARRLTT
jgi:hypothetical protein